MRYKLEISYDGKNYSGFQVQLDKITIQGVLEEKLSIVLKENIKITGSGRTDAGVSAFSQICHFDFGGALDCLKVLNYANHLLPSDIRISNIEVVQNDFNARYSAKSKQYDYYFYLGKVNAIYEKFAVNAGYNLDIEKMNNACKYIVGEHDFTSFCASNTSIKDKVRIVYDAKIIKIDDDLYKFSIVGNGFLYNMVRIIMGTLIEIGRGKIEDYFMETIINSKNREMAGKTALSKGLFLKKVTY